ncbi:Cell cycle serine/threonine-protein kinase cdc5/MSD2, partial [Coemansia sp. RSA 2322]
QNRIKIADFGLSTIVDSKSDRKKSFLGTPNFLAPELVTRNGEGHSYGVDVWATGILLYVMLYGKTPFSSQRVNGNLQQLYAKIASQNIEFPPDPHTSMSAKDLINNLCCKSEQLRVKASEICHESWFLIHADSSVPKFMPGAIFERPIRNLQEYKELVAGGSSPQRNGQQPPVLLPQPIPTPSSASARGFTTALDKPLSQVAPSKTVGRDTYSDRPGRRQPLDPIPEAVNRAVPSIATGGLRNGGVAEALAHASKTLGRAHAEAEKENRQVELQLDQLRLGSQHPPAMHQQSHGYSLRSRASKPSDIVCANGDGSKPTSRSRDAGVVYAPALVNKPPAQATATSLTNCAGTAAAAEQQQQQQQCQVRAEFGTVTKLSEEYIPSILKWKDRLWRFCRQTETYLRRPSSELEAELARDMRARGRAGRRADDYPRVGMYVLSWLILTKYGLGFQLSDGTMGTLFNDNTSLLNVTDSGDYVYVRPYLDRSSIGRFSKDRFPAQLDKKRNVLRSFGKKMSEKLRVSVDRDICPETSGPDLVKCLLQALSTSVGLVFLLTGNVLQFNMADHSKLFLYEDTHIFYKDARGSKWHFDLSQGPAML